MASRCNFHHGVGWGEKNLKLSLAWQFFYLLILHNGVSVASRSLSFQAIHICV